MGGEYGGCDGPCPPWNGCIVHRYHFTVYALNVEQVDLEGMFTGASALAVIEMRDAMNATSKPAAREVDEFDRAGLAREDCAQMPCSRVANALASMECKLVKTVDLPGEVNIVVFGEVTGILLRDEYLLDGIFDVTQFQPLARLGYRDCARVTELFSLQRPGAG